MNQSDAHDGENGGGTAALAWRIGQARRGREKTGKKDVKICKTKPTEARMSFRINKGLRKDVKNEPK